MSLQQDVQNLISGEILTKDEELEKYSHDASLFRVKPTLVVRPQNVEDISRIIKYVSENKSTHPELSVTVRAGGTDMSGGSINESIILDVAAHLNSVIQVGEDFAITQPGVYYRDFEKMTLVKGLLLPSYPASREICAVGGMVANNSGGEKSLAYGKTENYVEELDVILNDGNKYSFRPLNLQELEQKKSQTDLEGQVYRDIFDLVETNYDLVQRSKPRVSKNSAGYNLWSIWDRRQFDLSKLFVGSQGTLGVITQIKFRLIKPKRLSKLLVIFLPDLNSLGQVVKTVMQYKPESFESYDDHTLRLAIKFLPDMIKAMKGNFLTFSFKFLPEMWMTLTGGLPRLVLLAEFTDDQESTLVETVKKLKAELHIKFKLQTRIAKNESDAQKYWTMRRESFNLLRKHVSGRKTAPFIDDIIVRPEKLVDFLPKLEAILSPYKNLVYTIAGHAGDGNFHIIPLMVLDDPSQRQVVKELSKKVYDLVIAYGGSITAEHNDGLIRTPYLEQMYGPQMYSLFQKTKKIFDPQNIFNPRKKVGLSGHDADIQYALDHIK